MAINSKGIETLWQRYSAEGVGKGISVAQYFESNGVPYHTFEKWYKKKYSQSGIVDCVVSSESDGSLQVSGGGKKYIKKMLLKMGTSIYCDETWVWTKVKMNDGSFKYVKRYMYWSQYQYSTNLTCGRWHCLPR